MLKSCGLIMLMMNICDKGSEQDIAKTFGDCTNGGIIYSLSDSSHSIALDKKTIITSEIHACEKLASQTNSELERQLAEKEIADLKLALDLLP